jgi:hypothetical protein
MSSQRINTESILSLNLQMDEQLYNASQTHFKHREQIPQLDLTILQPPPEVIQRQAVVANKVVANEPKQIKNLTK